MRLPALSLVLPFSSVAFARWNHHDWSSWHPGPDQSHNGDTAKTIDLTRTGRTLRSQNGSIEVRARIPLQQWVDLYAAGVIGNPSLGLNHTYETWVRYPNWTCSRPIHELHALL